jgi:hypothetical protein
MTPQENQVLFAMRVSLLKCQALLTEIDNATHGIPIFKNFGAPIKKVLEDIRVVLAAEAELKKMKD